MLFIKKWKWWKTDYKEIHKEMFIHFYHELFWENICEETVKFIYVQDLYFLLE